MRWSCPCCDRPRWAHRIERLVHFSLVDCEDTPPNIVVFIDGSSPTGTVALDVRNWKLGTRLERAEG